MSVLAIIPTWILFRHSPRHTRHTIPEGFFIQVFLSVIQVVINILVIPFAIINSDLTTGIAALFIMLYYIITYKQLFGYKLWGTLWRQGFILTCISCIEMVLLFLFTDSRIFERGGFTPDEAVRNRYLAIAALLMTTVMALAVGYAVNQIATRKARKSAEQS